MARNFGHLDGDILVKRNVLQDSLGISNGRMKLDPCFRRNPPFLNEVHHLGDADGRDADVVAVYACGVDEG
jgi:hypothetical protein